MLQKFGTNDWTNMSYMPDAISNASTHPCDLTVDAVGRLYSTGKFAFEQVSSMIALHSCEAGEGTIVADGVSYTMKQGDLFTFFPGRHYRYFDRAETPWRYDWCRLSGRLAQDSLVAIGITPQSPLSTGGAALQICPVLKQIADAFSGTVPSSFYPQAAAWRIVSAIAENRQPATIMSKRSVAEDARAIMNDDFAVGLSIDEIARRTGVSRSTLFRQFRERYGSSPKDYLDAVRLNRARQLLRHSATPIHEIAAVCGYEDSHYFSRAYKIALGCTPTEDRDNHQRRLAATE